jgi:hypothetical protein
MLTRKGDTTMKTQILIAMLTASAAMAQVVISDGTKIRVRLEENLSSETTEMGQVVDFAVTQEVRVGDAVVVANGARATGSITLVEPKRRLGRAGKLDFSIDRVQMVDGNWLNVRYTPHKNRGKGNGITTGVLTAGIAVVFLPAAPIALLIKGRDATIQKGRTYDVFSDDSVLVANAVAASSPLTTRALPQAQPVIVRQPNGGAMNNGGLPTAINTAYNPVLVSNASMVSGPAQADTAAGYSGNSATLSVNADEPGADIEVDGRFVGNAPTAITLPAGDHKIVVKNGSRVWQREIQITGGTISINATLGGATVKRASR